MCDRTNHPDLVHVYAGRHEPPRLVTWRGLPCIGEAYAVAATQRSSIEPEAIAKWERYAVAAEPAMIADGTKRGQPLVQQRQHWDPFRRAMIALNADKGAILIDLASTVTRGWERGGNWAAPFGMW